MILPEIAYGLKKKRPIHRLEWKALSPANRGGILLDAGRFCTDPCDTMEALPLTIPWKLLVRVFLKLSAHFSGEQDVQTISIIGGGPSSEPQNRRCPRGKLLLEVDGIERTRIMEGGEAAFNLRKEKYGF